MINLTNRAAKRFKVQWKELEDRSGDFWKVDVVIFERVPMLFIVHEYTLFTLVRRKSQFRNLEEITGIETAINRCIYSYLSPEPYRYGNPLEAVESYLKGETPWL